jgi:prolyl-tRNA synthetase
VKFNDADLLGMPVRLTVSPRTMKQGVVEMKQRTEAKASLAPAAEAAGEVRRALGG